MKPYVTKKHHETKLTATQRRNARKRRAKRAHPTSAEKRGAASTARDPSLKFISDPRKAPVCLLARRFFSDKFSTFEVRLGPTTGWRTVARLAVRSDEATNELTLGLFLPKSHQVVSALDNPTHHVSINTVGKAVQSICRQQAIRPFNEADGSGQLKYVAMCVERTTGHVQLTLVWKREHSTQSTLRQLCVAIEQHELIHSLWINYSSASKHDNAIFSQDSRDWEHIFGPNCIVEHLLAAQQDRPPLHFSPNVFRQANLDAFAEVVKDIHDFLSRSLAYNTALANDKAPAILELYGGVGTIGLHLMDVCSSLVCSDENPNNKACFEESFAELQTGNDKLPLAFYESLSAADMIRHTNRWLERCDVLVVDPPRKGLDVSVRQAIKVCQRPSVLAYVSCGFEAFQRDYRNIVHDNRWKLDFARGYVLFPGSDAIETLAIFTRGRK